MGDFVKVTPSIRYAVGIDFGHGECSAAQCEIGWGKESVLLDGPEDIRIYGNNSYTIPSAYAINSSGRMAIGHEAIGNVKDAVDFKISFKERPSEMGKEELLKYTEYLKLVHLQAIDHSSIPHGQYVVYLSCPSGWSDQDRAIFHKMAVDAKIPVAGLWSESRAGLFSNMENQKDEVKMLMKEGCILVDIGSSTIDFSYLNSSLSTPVRDSGIEEGAQALDMMLYYYILSLPGNEKAKEMVSQPETAWLKDVLVYTCRESKEKFFGSGLEADFSCSFDFAEQFFGEEERSLARFRCNKANGGKRETILNLFMKGLNGFGLSMSPDPRFKSVDWDAVQYGYFSKFAKRLQDFVRGSVKGKPVKVILLSGGASFMFLGAAGERIFRETILQPVFGDNDIVVTFDGKPSTSVSRGICSIGRAFAKYRGCEEFSDAPEYKSLATRISETTEYHLSVLHEAGSYIKNSTIPRDKAQRIPFGDPAKHYLKAALTDVNSVISKAFKALGFRELTDAVLATNTPSLDSSTILAEQYESFLSDIASRIPAFRMTMAKVVTEAILPMAKDYVDQFTGDNIQQLRDGLAKMIEEHYPEISEKVMSAIREHIKKELSLQRSYSTELISLYTASLQKDFLLDQNHLNEKIHIPTVDYLFEQVDIYENFEVIGSIILSVMMAIVNVAVNTFFLGIPYLVSYIVFVFKENNWSLSEWGEWQAEKFMLVDLSNIRIHKVGRSLLKQAFSWQYKSNMTKMKKNIARTLASHDFDNTVIEAFRLAAGKSTDRYIHVVDNIFA